MEVETKRVLSRIQAELRRAARDRAVYSELRSLKSELVRALSPSLPGRNDQEKK